MSKLPYIKPKSLSFEIDINQPLLSGSNDIFIYRGTMDPTDITPQAKIFNGKYWDEDGYEEEGY